MTPDSSVESSLFCRISDSHAVRGKARPAGNIGNIAKDCNEAVALLASSDATEQA